MLFAVLILCFLVIGFVVPLLAGLCFLIRASVRIANKKSRFARRAVVSGWVFLAAVLVFYFPVVNFCVSEFMAVKVQAQAMGAGVGLTTDAFEAKYGAAEYRNDWSSGGGSLQYALPGWVFPFQYSNTIAIYDQNQVVIAVAVVD